MVYIDCSPDILSASRQEARRSRKEAILSDFEQVLLRTQYLTAPLLTAYQDEDGPLPCSELVEVAKSCCTMMRRLMTPNIGSD